MGTTHRLVGSIQVGDAHVSFGFGQAGKSAARGAMTLALERANSEDRVFEWSDQPKLPLERQLDAVARRMLEFAEERLRSHAQYQYEWALARQADMRRAILQEQEAAERERLAAINAQQQRVRDRLHRLAGNLRKAREIRDLVALIEQRVGDNGTAALSAVFDKWRNEALAEADRLDPALMPLEAVLAAKQDRGIEPALT